MIKNIAKPIVAQRGITVLQIALALSGLRLEQFLTAESECFHNAGIGKCGDVAEIGFVASDLPQDATHDLS